MTATMEDKAIQALREANTKTFLKDLLQENKDLRAQIKALQSRDSIVGWKGTSSLTIEPLGKDEFLITEARKSKHTGEVKFNKHIINRKSVNMVLTVIRGTTEQGKIKTSYKEIVSELCTILNLRLSPSSFFGRRKLYHIHYYWAMKVMEYKGIIKYGGGGVTELLDKKIRSV